MATSRSRNVPPLVGKTFDTWRCQSQLGTGSFGIVHVWKNLENCQLIALKKCRFGPEVLLSEKHRDQWCQEVDIMQRLEHPNVVKCYPTPAELLNIYGSDDPLPMLCMEFCSGGDLRKLLNQPKSSVGLDQVEVLNCVSDLTSALGFLHNRRIIHRDLKPENVVIQEGPDQNVYKLIDLGYAKELGQSSMALSFVGTLQYIAPELFLSQEYTKSVDYWSLGFLCFEIITGKRPFLPNQSPGQWMEHVRAKNSKQICIYQSEPDGGEICRRETFFDQNFLDVSVAKDLELWLQPLLEWNPSIRGKDDKGRVVLFTQLEQILSKPRLHIVIMTKSTPKLDFVFDPTSDFTDLRHWLTSSMKVPDKYLMLSHNGIVISQPDDLSTSEVRLMFVVPLDMLPLVEMVKSVGISIPESIQPFLQSPRKAASYLKRKQLCQHTFFFMKMEQRMCLNFESGLKSLCQYLTSRVKKVSGECLEASKMHQCCLAKLELFQESLQHDIDKYKQQAQQKDHITSKQMFDSWVQSGIKLNQELSSLERDFEVLRFEIKSNTANYGEVLKKWTKKMEDLKEFEEISLDKVESLKTISPEKRKEKGTVMDIAQLVVKALKQRDKFLREYFSRYNEIIEYHKRIDMMQASIRNMKQGFQSLNHNTARLLKRRQSDVWKLLAAAVSQSQNKPPDQKSKIGASQSHEPLGSPLALEQSFLESERHVLANEELRKQLKDLMK